MRHFHLVRARAVAIHDVVQFGAGMLASIALLLFLALSGRDADDPVIRMLVDVGAVMAQADLVAMITSSVGSTETRVQPADSARTAGH